jgi:ParB family chromosome partitioning protein
MQLMMDLGSNVEEIADLTGMSGSSVRRRLDVARLPREQLHGAEERGGCTLGDYIRIASLKREVNQKKALSAVGTSNFEWTISTLTREEQKEDGKKRLLAEAGRLGIKKYSGKSSHPQREMDQVIMGPMWKAADGLAGFDFGKVKLGDYYFINAVDDYFYILREKKQETKKDKPKKSDAEIFADERRKALGDLNVLARSMRENFVKRFSATTKFREVIRDAFIEARTAELLEYIDTDWELLCWAVGKERKTKYERLTKEELMTLTATDDNLLFLTYACMGDVETLRPYDEGWGDRAPEWKPEKAKKFDRIYGLLEKLGYEISDEEKAFLDGTHELYKKEAGEK